jgi:hypothetical protein
MIPPGFPGQFVTITPRTVAHPFNAGPAILSSL